MNYSYKKCNNPATDTLTIELVGFEFQISSYNIHMDDFIKITSRLENNKDWLER